MTTWIDKPELRFEGCLVVLNMGNDNISSLPKDYVAAVQEEVALAHADGKLVLYIFDNERGAQPPPNEFDQAEDMDAVRMGFDVCGRTSFEFSAERLNEELREMAFEALEKSGFRAGAPDKIVGLCSVESKPTLLPVTVLV